MRRLALSAFLLPLAALEPPGREPADPARRRQDARTPSPGNGRRGAGVAETACVPNRAQPAFAMTSKQAKKKEVNRIYSAQGWDKSKE